MSSLADLIKEINTQISTVSKSFVYYDKETGKIQKISNKKVDSDLEFFEVETETVKDIIVGKKRTEDFIVSYDFAKKSLTVKELAHESELNSIKYKLHDISRSKNDSYDVKISQDLTKKCWRISLSNDTKKQLIESNYNANDKFYFSITQLHNPIILYRSLEVNLRKLLSDSVEYPFEYSWESQKEEISIYTPKFFDSYFYEVID
jgi:hypothetical protein